MNFLGYVLKVIVVILAIFGAFASYVAVDNYRSGNIQVDVNDTAVNVSGKIDISERK